MLLETAALLSTHLQNPGSLCVVTYAREITNYYACYVNQALPNQKNGALGHEERALAIVEVLDACSRKRQLAWKALRCSSL